MDITKSQADRHSEHEFSKKLLQLIDAGAGVIHVRAKEILRAVSCVRKTILVDKGVYKEWDVVNGNRQFTLQQVAEDAMVGDGKNDLSETFQLPLGVIRDGKYEEHIRAFVYVNPHVFVENNPHMVQLMLMYNEFLPALGACVIMVTPDAPLPDNAANDSILSLHFDTPSMSELRDSLDLLLEGATKDFSDGVDLDDDDRDRVCHTGAGMTRLQFEMHVAMSTIKASADKLPTLDADMVAAEVQIGKTEIVNSSDILELYKSTDISEVGGMENLKEWIDQRKNCFSEEAREFGVEPPKGIVLVGPPGTGKSLVAKAIASVLSVPLVRFDFGRVFSSLVGSSEARIRQALKMVEAMAPCVLFVDEVDKGLGGIGGGSDSGVSTRVLGSFLTWLNDTTSPVFTMMTANSITGLPPELSRKGRFDEIFATSLPNRREREDVFEIHLNKRGGRTLDSFAKSDVKDLVDKTDRFVPAEIEAVVKSALVMAFNANEELSAKHLYDAAEATVPMSQSHSKAIQAMEDWSAANAVPVSRPEVAKAPPPAAVNARRVSTRRRG